jgi:hypothetical protein
MITKEIVNAGLTKFFPVVVLTEDQTSVIIDGSDYSNFRLNEGLSDREIMSLPDVLRPAGVW